MPTDSSSEELDAIIDKATVALTGYTEEQTVNPDLPSLLEITDFDTRVVNTYELKQAIDRLIADKVAEELETWIAGHAFRDHAEQAAIDRAAQLRQNREGADNE